MALLARGRGREIRQIRARLRHGRPRVLLLEGEAGIGKSHLADAATEMLHKWWVAFHPAAGAPAQGLREVAALANDPELIGLLEGRADDPAGRRLAILAAVNTLLEHLGPPALVLDDVQWADRLTLDWLAQSGPTLKRAPTQLVLTLRSPRASGAFGEALAPLEGEGLVERIELGGLGAGSVRELAGDLGAPLTQSQARDLAGRSGGNPLLVREAVLRFLRRGPEASRGSRSYARSLGQVVGEQIAEIGKSARHLVSVAALGPQPLTESLLSAASGLSMSSYESACEEAVACGLLVLDAGSVRFAHDLQREAVEMLLRVEERRRLHRRIARLLAQRADANPLQVAHQLLASGDLQEAVVWLRRAGEHAVRCYDHSGAVEAFAEALRHCPPGGLHVAELVEELGRAARLASAPRRGLELLDELEEGVGVGPAAGDFSLAKARLRSYLDDYDGRTEALLKAERAFARWDNGRGRVIALGELAHPVGRSFTLAERIRYGEEAVGLAEDLGEAFASSYSKANLASTVFYSGDVSAIGILLDARTRLDMSSRHDRIEFVRQSLNLATYLLWLGDHAGCRRALLESRAVVDEPFWEGALRFADGVLAWRSGSWDQALPALEAAGRDGSVGFYRVAEVIRLSILFERGASISTDHLEDALSSLVGKKEDLWDSLALALCIHMRAWRREPNPLRGLLGHLRDIHGIGLRVGTQDLLPVLGSIDDGVAEQASSAVRELLPPGQHAAACSLLGEGLRLARADRPSEALDAFDGARGAFAELGDRYYEAWTLDEASRVASSWQTARDAARGAAALYADLGAARSLTRLVRRSRRRGLLTHHPIPESQRGKGAPGLTERELQVALLSGKGYSAEEIAKELVISPSTVRKHVEHIKQKLGIRRKSELVRLLNE